MDTTQGTEFAGQEPQAEYGMTELPSVPEAPRSSAPGLVTGLGLLLAGMGAASGLALLSGNTPLQKLALKASDLGLSPGLCLVGGAVLLGAGLVGFGLARLLRRTIDTLDLASDPLPLLEGMRLQLEQAHLDLAMTEQRLGRELRSALAPLNERLGGLEAAFSAARANLDDDHQATDALWRLAASMDQIRAQLDRRLEQQLASYEVHLGQELERATAAHLAALEQALRSSERRVRHEVAPSAIGYGTSGHGEGEPRAAVSQPPAAAPRTAPAPAPSTQNTMPAWGPPPARPAPAPRAAAQPPAARRPAPAPQDPLGVFDQLDERGQTRTDVLRNPAPPLVSRPTEPMPDLYQAQQDELPDVDSVPPVRPTYDEARPETHYDHRQRGGR